METLVNVFISIIALWFITLPFGPIWVHRMRYYEKRMHEYALIPSVPLSDELPEIKGFGFNVRVFTVPNFPKIGEVIVSPLKGKAIIISNLLLATPDFKDFVVAHEAEHIFLLLNKKNDFFFLAL